MRLFNVGIKVYILGGETNNARQVNMPRRRVKYLLMMIDLCEEMSDQEAYIVGLSLISLRLDIYKYSPNML